MSLVSQQQLAQNQLQLKSLTEQQQRQMHNSKSLTSQGSTQEVVNKLREKDKKKSRAVSSRPKDPSDPLSIQMPTNANPTDVLAARFSSWRTITLSLLGYLREIVSVNEEVIRQQIRLHHALTFPFLAQGLDGDYYKPLRLNQDTAASANPQGSHANHNQQNTATNSGVDEFQLAESLFLPLGNGSIQDLPTVLYQYHSNAALLAQTTVKELTQTVIPTLEGLRRDLLVKIKEIKGLQSDFKTTLLKEGEQTSQLLQKYIKSVELSKTNPAALKPENDPFMLKTALDRQIRKQLTEENYLHEAFINLQSSGKELEKVVYVEIQTALTVYAKLVGQQAQAVFDSLIVKLDSTILTKNPEFEWNPFIARDPNFIDPNLPMRHFSEIKYSYQTDPIVYEIRSGYLEKKSKFLKSYSRSWYVLTSNFLHEFKSADKKKDPLPINSLSLDEFQLIEHERRDPSHPESPHKFVLALTKSRTMSMKTHKWTFRGESFDSMMAWYNDLKQLTNLPTPQARSKLAYERRLQAQHRKQASTTTNAGLGSITTQPSVQMRSRMNNSVANGSVMQDTQSSIVGSAKDIDTLETDTILTMPGNEQQSINLQQQMMTSQQAPSENHQNNTPSIPSNIQYVTVKSANGKQMGIPNEEFQQMNIKDYEQSPMANSGTLQLKVAMNDSKVSSTTDDVASSYNARDDHFNGGTAPFSHLEETYIDHDNSPKKETQNDE